MKKRESVLLIPILSLEPLVKSLRNKYDPSSLCGIPTHVTILCPFKNPDYIVKKVIAKLRFIFLKERGFQFTLQRINTFPGVVFLDPLERDPFIVLTEKVVKAFPEHLPYEGTFTEINPHLTIGHKLGDKFDQALMETKRKIEDKLPIKARAQEVWLMESENGMWKILEKFPLLI